MPSEFAVVPYIANPVAGDITGWLRVGSGSPHFDSVISTTHNHLVKCAYYKRSSTSYAILAMAKSTGEQIVVYYQNLDDRWSLSFATLSNSYEDAKYWSFPSVYPDAPVNTDIPVYYPDGNITALDIAKEALYYSSWDEPTPPVTQYPITYRLTNATAPDAPTEAEIGDTVTVDLEFPEGYGIVNPQTDIYVTCNGVTVQSSYSAGRLVFTMPDPT